MGLDLRWPIGLMFSLIGAMLSVTGLITASDSEILKRSLGININLWWGLVLLVFGVFMLLMAKSGSKSAGDGQQTGEEKSQVTINFPQKQQPGQDS
jgi:hypothetical protein